MKYRYNSYIDSLGKLCYIIEYNETDQDYEEDWFELEDIVDKEIIIDIVNLLNTKYSKKPFYKYKKKGVNNMETFNIADTVAITSSEYHTNNVYVPKGQVGTVVEIFSKDDHTAYEVEFCDKNGRTLFQAAVKEKDLIKLHFN